MAMTGERDGEAVVDGPAMNECSERGSGTVLMAGVMVLAGFLIMVSLLLASAIVARHRAGAIADLSALAAASGTTASDGCERARRVAGANHGRLLTCRVLADGSMVVDVELIVGGLPGPARASARAGQRGVLNLGAKPLDLGAKPLDQGAKPLDQGARPLDQGANNPRFP